MVVSWDLLFFLPSKEFELVEVEIVRLHCTNIDQSLTTLLDSLLSLSAFNSFNFSSAVEYEPISAATSCFPLLAGYSYIGHSVCYIKCYQYRTTAISSLNYKNNSMTISSYRYVPCLKWVNLLVTTALVGNEQSTGPGVSNHF